MSNSIPYVKKLQCSGEPPKNVVTLHIPEEKRDL